MFQSQLTMGIGIRVTDGKYERTKLQITIINNNAFARRERERESNITHDHDTVGGS